VAVEAGILEMAGDEGTDRHQQSIARFEDQMSKIPLMRMVDKTFIVEPGQVVKAILRQAEAHRADLIVMGTVGAAGIKEVFLGSNTARVVAQSDRPVMVIPPNARFTGLERLAFAYDFHAIANDRVQQWLAAFAHGLISEIHLIHVAEKAGTDWPEAAKAAIEAGGWLKSIKHHYYLVEHSNLQEGLTKYVRQHRIGALALLHRPHRWFEQLMNTSFSRQMAYHTDIPLLILYE